MTIILNPVRYIPYRKADIIEMCLSDGKLDDVQTEHFRTFCRLLQSVFHHEYHQIQEQLKDAYAPVNPDADTRSVPLMQKERPPRFIELLEKLLDKANYEKVSDADLQQALQ